ncbi:MAG: CHAT domain-containing protein, partial [Bacteroidota bacterium]
MREQLQEADKDSLRLEVLEGELADEQNRYYAFLQTMKKTYPDFKSALEPTPQIDLLHLRQQLAQRDAILLEYFWGEEALYLLSIESEHQQIFKIEKNATLDQQLQGFLTYFQSPQAISNDPQKYQQDAQDLAAILFPKNWRKDTSIQQLVLIPDGWLKYLPFEALVLSPNSDTPYLLHHFVSQYANSTALYLSEKPETPWYQEALKVSPGFEKGQRGLSPLLHSQKELAHLARGIDLRTSAATFTAFKTHAPQSKAIHLSTHASANTAAQNAQIEFYDQTIYLPQIYALDLSADLVVLSTCESGMGKIEKGEGVISLGRAFRYAGAASVIASLWKVNEASTADIFAHFYQTLQKGVGKATALRAAKLHYLASAKSDLKRSPYYWSAFVYFGTNDP